MICILLENLTPNVAKINIEIRPNITNDGDYLQTFRFVYLQSVANINISRYIVRSVRQLNH